ncbi:hypothetical protein AVEN_198421-1, partial [Araneus ventricosus]
HLRRSLNVRTPEIEDLVLDRFGAASRTSTQALAAANGAEWSALLEEGLQPFHVQRVQCLNADDNFRRLNFMRRMLQVRANNPQFPAFVLFTDKAQGRIYESIKGRVTPACALDEASFTRNGIFNIRNEYF